MTALDSQSTSPSLLLRLVALKKAIFAVLILFISAISAFSWRNYDAVTAFANTYVLTAEYDLVRWLLTTISHAGPETLKLVARATSVYGSLLGLAAWGLWVGKAWAEPLFIGLVGILLPLEGYEVIHHASISKVVFLVINLIVVLFLLVDWLRHFQAEKTPLPG